MGVDVCVCGPGKRKAYSYIVYMRSCMERESAVGLCMLLAGSIYYIELGKLKLRHCADRG